MGATYAAKSSVFCIYTLCFASIVGAQTSSRITAPTSASAQKQTITYDISGVGGKNHWALAITPKESRPDFDVAVGFARPLGVDGVTQANEAQGKLSKEYFSLSDSSFRLLGAKTLDRSIWIMSEVPSGKPVTVIADGIVVFHGTIAGPELLVDGNLSSIHDQVRTLAISMLVAPKTIEEEFGSGLLLDSNGGWKVSASEMRRHLKQMPQLIGPFTGQSFPDGEGMAIGVFFTLQITESGDVDKIEVKRGSGPLAEKGKDALLYTKFVPFLVNGVPVRVHGDVDVSLFKDYPDEPSISLGAK